MLNKIILYSPKDRIIYFYSTPSINSVLNLHSFDILYLFSDYKILRNTKIFLHCHKHILLGYVKVFIVENKKNIMGNISIQSKTKKSYIVYIKSLSVYFYKISNNIKSVFMTILCKMIKQSLLAAFYLSLISYLIL